MPEHAEKEIGFSLWLKKLWNIAQNSSAKLVFFASKEAIAAIDELQLKHPIVFEYHEFTNWNNFLALKNEMLKDDNLVIVLSRKNMPSYDTNMSKIPTYLNTYFNKKSYLLIYPKQAGVKDSSPINLTNPTLLEPFDKMAEIEQSISKIFRKKQSK